MERDIAKAIAIASIWLSTSIILGFGLFRMNLSGDAGGFFLFFTTILVLSAASYFTLIIWKNKQ